jgi:hypothetical protein
MWPSSGSACAARIRGCAVVGPGPISSLVGTCMEGSTVQYSLIMLGTVIHYTAEMFPASCTAAARRIFVMIILFS